MTLTQTSRHAGTSARAWSVGWRSCGCAFVLSATLSVLVTLAQGGAPGTQAAWHLIGVLGARALLTVALCVPAAALLTALLARRPVIVQVVAFAAAGAVLGRLSDGWVGLPGSGELWLDAALAAAAGRAIVAWRDARRAAAQEPGGVPQADPSTADAGQVAAAGGAVAGGAVAGSGVEQGYRWESPLAWFVATVGMLAWPLVSGFGAVVTLASFFGEPPTASDHVQAATYLWTGAAVAVVASVVVILLGVRVGRRGGRLRGGVGLAVWGFLVAVVLAVAADGLRGGAVS
ncbi:hypothetical protein LEP48_14865 [Isoptericola sp. NEAU-Y5]|uniref:Integral membrane protein n=1 Tax=Isoptericola luteus TaxID=2879484 RepID=A0ABS7ZL71_9MICO|nr:hypothetical protein [Isoptericola sp. NEAU-Y5]MCA5894619.1 hypothetical protein [Isoptericola sp. NEAU-Y5]